MPENARQYDACACSDPCDTENRGIRQRTPLSPLPCRACLGGAGHTLRVVAYIRTETEETRMDDRAAIHRAALLYCVYARR